MNVEVAKVVLLGDSGVGKTSIINRFMTGRSVESLKPTVGAAFVTKNMTIDGHSLELRIWDTAGQEVYRGLAPMYYRSANVAIIVFDVTNPASYESVDYWVQELKKNLKEAAILIICGNKNDLYEERVIHDSQARDYATENGALYIETSASKGTGVSQLFETAISKMLKENTASNTNGGVNITEDDKKKEGGCSC